MFSIASRRLIPSFSNALRFSSSALRLSTSTLSEGEQAIHTKLTNKFAPLQLRVQDVSGGCGTFYAISITSDVFKGIPIVKQHKLVTEALKQEIEGIHGLQFALKGSLRNLQQTPGTITEQGIPTVAPEFMQLLARTFDTHASEVSEMNSCITPY